MLHIRNTYAISRNYFPNNAFLLTLPEHCSFVVNFIRPAELWQRKMLVRSTELVFVGELVYAFTRHTLFAQGNVHGANYELLTHSLALG